MKKIIFRNKHKFIFLFLSFLFILMCNNLSIKPVYAVCNSNPTVCNDPLSCGGCGCSSDTRCNANTGKCEFAPGCSNGTTARASGCNQTNANGCKPGLVNHPASNSCRNPACPDDVNCCGWTDTSGPGCYPVVSGKLSKTQVDPGGAFDIYCTYSGQSNCGGVSAPASCTFQHFMGAGSFEALFSCKANIAVGVYPVSCTTWAPSVSIVSVGNLTIGNPPTPTPTTAPSCPATAPSGISVSWVTGTKATVSWTAGAGGVKQLLRIGENASEVNNGCPGTFGTACVGTSCSTCVVKEDSLTATQTSYTSGDVFVSGKTYNFRLVTYKDASCYKDASVTSTKGGATVTSTPTPSPVPGNVTNTPPPASCTKKAQGDANCDGKINLIDHSLWLNSQCNTKGVCGSLKADFSGDGLVNDTDFQIWFDNRYE